MSSTSTVLVSLVYSVVMLLGGFLYRKKEKEKKKKRKSSCSGSNLWCQPINFWIQVVLDLDETLVCAYETSSLPAIVRTQATEAGLKCFELECISSDKVITLILFMLKNVFLSEYFGQNVY